MDEILYEHLPNIMNQKDLFGPQYVMNAEDEVIDEVDKLLISATDIGITELSKIVKTIGGIIVPAHIDRKSYSIMVSLGFVPPDLPIKTLEVSKMMDFDTAKKKFRFFKEYQLIHGSDAHQLEDMAEREYFIDLPDLRKRTLLEHLGEL
ncbi:MAG: hypothetical protein RR564_00235 [Eubacterium sp.]